MQAGDDGFRRAMEAYLQLSDMAQEVIRRGPRAPAGGGLDMESVHLVRLGGYDGRNGRRLIQQVPLDQLETIGEVSDAFVGDLLERRVMPTRYPWSSRSSAR